MTRDQGGEVTDTATRDAAPNQSSSALLEVRNLRTSFGSGSHAFKAVDGVSFDVFPGETLCIVGESGSGKSVTALSIMGLISDPGKVEAQSIRFESIELTGLTPAERRDLRGNRIGMIFQEPMTSLNPALTIGEQIAESLVYHRRQSHATALENAVQLLRLVRIPSPEQRIEQYPHQLSGGMRQRVMIAIALACDPRLLIADEPTTALDVTIQAQILDLMRALRRESGMAIMLITHDLGVVAEIADRVALMYAGKIVETGKVADIFDDPQHPYTLGLLSSIPSLDEHRERLRTIAGSVPLPGEMPQGCRFHPRCVFADAKCIAESPPLVEIAEGHLAACWKVPVDCNG